MLVNVHYFEGFSHQETHSSKKLHGGLITDFADRSFSVSGKVIRLILRALEYAVDSSSGRLENASYPSCILIANKLVTCFIRTKVLLAAQTSHAAPNAVMKVA